MPLTNDAQARVDQLAADLSRVRSQHLEVVSRPDTSPMFTKHHDGTVTDRRGVILLKGSQQ
jgi:hypothetical protein